MRRVMPAFLALLLAVPACRTGEPPKDKDKAAQAATPDQQSKDPVQDSNKQMAEFYQAYNTEMAEFYQAYNKAKTPKERQKIRQGNAAKLLKLAEDHPGSRFVADALAWVVSNTSGGPAYEKARDLLLKDHIQSKAIAQIIPKLSNQTSPQNVTFLRRIIKESPDHQVQGQASFTLAQMLVRLKEDKAAEKEFEKVVKEYGDVKQLGRSLADQAQRQLYELHLAVGMVAPNIVGEDADGKKFQLSDYRGKVVVLDFWAEW